MHLPDLLADTNTVGPYGTALVAAGGVLVGGFITAGSNLFVERQRRRQADEARVLENRRELRQAVRIVLEEFSAAVGIILDAAKRDAELENCAYLPTGGWADHHTTLAGFLSDEAWRWGTLANRTILELNANRSAGYIIDLAEMRNGWATIRAAMSILEGELARETEAVRGGIYQYTGYASDDDIWPEGQKPRAHGDGQASS